MGFTMLSIFRPILLSSLATIALASPVVAVAAPTSAASTSKTITVAANGSDRAAGTVSAPLLTVQEAIKRLNGGGTI